jgi:enolase-phosphatase E1
MPYSDAVTAILLDIEGTTTPVSYVFEVLFPFARDNAEVFLETRGEDADVLADLALLRQEYEAESEEVPPWEAGDAIAAVPYVHYLIGCDGVASPKGNRKSTALKSLQGKIWDAGYQAGQLRSQLFADVPPTLERWKKTEKAIYIFSSGSIQAQKLIFQYSEAGDFTAYINNYFDTTTGPKREAQSYQKIAEAIEALPEQILFISDVAAELRAAQAVGLQTLFCDRPGNATHNAEGFTAIQNFDGV